MDNRRAKSRVGCTVAAILAIAAVGCGGSAPPAEVPAAAPVAKEVSAMKMFVAGAAHGEVTQAVKDALVSHGYTIVMDVKQPHELLVLVAATTGVEPSLFAVEVNGVRKEKLRYNVSLTITGAKDKEVIDNATAQFVAVSQEVTQATVEPLFTALTNSGKVARYAQDKKDKKDAEEKAAADTVKRGQEAHVAAMKRRDDELQEGYETAWKASGSDDCAAAKGHDSCATLVAWMKTNAANPHTTEGAEIIRKSSPQIATLKDEYTWKNATVDACKAPKTGEDCLSVEAYVATFPDGVHAKEAKEIVSKSAPKIVAIQKSEVQRAEAEKKKEEKEECKRSCKADLQWRVMHPQYQTLLGRCIQNKCN